MIKALVWDFDGLIVDTETPEYRCWCEIYRIHGYELPLSVWSPCVGSGREVFDPHRYLEMRIGRKLDREALRAERTRRYRELVEAQPVLPGVRTYLDDARRLGLRIGLASCSRRETLREHLSRLGLIACFDHMVCGDDVSRLKPDPALYLAALRALGIRAAEAIALEDSPNGVLAAKDAGIFCVAVPNPVTRSLAFPGADLRLASLDELPLQRLLEIAAMRIGASCGAGAPSSCGCG